MQGPSGHGSSWLCFQIRNWEYAVPLSDVAEVSAGRSRHLIPTLSVEVGGIVNLRGEPIPALDGGLLLVGVPSRSDRQLLILERGPVRVGLCVDSVRRMVRDMDSELAEASPDADESASNPRGRCFSERITKRRQKIRLVDSDALLARAVALMSDVANSEGEVRCHTGY